MCQWFAPTKLVVTFERDGIGKFSDEDLERYLVKNDKGEVVNLDLPTKLVLIANHQVRNHTSAAGTLSLILLDPHRYTPTGGMPGVSSIS